MHVDAAYLNPHPVPPRTIAATKMAPAMEPIMMLVPLGPVEKEETKMNCVTIMCILDMQHNVQNVQQECFNNYNKNV